MNGALCANVWLATFECLMLVIAFPARSQGVAIQPGDGVGLAQEGTESPQAKSLYIQGHDAQVRNDLQTALGLLDQVIGLTPHFFPAYVDRGIVHYKMEQFELAASDFSRAIELGKPNATLRFSYKLLGTCYRKLNRPLDAVRVYSEYLNGAGSTDWDGVAERGEAYAQAHDAVNASHDYQRALQLSPDNPQVMGMITVLDLQTGDWARALTDSTRWLALEPGQKRAIEAQAIARNLLSGGKTPANRQ
jgi:tetratricopeptide (TPR) repeat protein